MANNNEEEETRSRNEEPSERVYKTKLIQFLGRTTPIILQNDNGPCPLLAICNVLLLKNSLNLNGGDSSGEVSLQRLLTLVADRLIESNSNSENKDAGYLENQRQNISDALNLLDRLATGIDVNVQFRKISDFEFTRECAIFDLLDIPLYHGWIVDPQDSQTAIAIGSKSYNTLMGELVALETTNSEEVHKSSPEEDCVDFAAATTATLGVPSPTLSRARSLDDSPRSVSGLEGARKGDREEEAELLRALKLSDTELQTSFDESPLGETNRNDISAFANESTSFEAGVGGDMLEGHSGGHLQFDKPAQSTVDNNASGDCDSGRQSSETNRIEKDQEHFKISTKCSISSDLKEHVKSADLVLNETLSNTENSFTSCKDHEDGPIQDQMFQDMRAQASTSSIHLEQEIDQRGCEKTAFSATSATDADSDLSGGMRDHMDIHKSDTSSPVGSEPIYEGEDRILRSGLSSYQNREPMYEGEVILAEQAGKGTDESNPNNDITHHNGEVIGNFFKNSASQLTIYGLFCLLEGLKERELCVFFRNNHFSTMFKFKGELYLLATDQGFINQPDLVWEKLNEVNGDTVFMTGDFTEFKVDNHTNDNWDQQNAMASTADYLASIDNSMPSNSSFNSDLQLAIALQQQEFDNQPQHRQNSQQHQNSKQHQNSQQQSSGGTSRLITGPQDRRSSASNSSSKQESKSKDKCTVM